MIIRTVTRAIKPLRKIIILTAVPNKILVSKTRFVHSVGIQKSLFPPQFPHPYAILTIGSAKSIIIKPIVAVIKILFPFWNPSSPHTENMIL
jgi:hypothetical protein